MEPKRVLKESVIFAGGRLCLDFVNTACEIRGKPLELIEDLEELNQWLGNAGLRYAIKDQAWKADDGEKSLIRAHELRNVLWDLINAVLEKRPPAAASLKFLNSVLRASPTFPQVDFGREGFHAGVSISSTRDPWYSAIAHDAVELLCDSDLSLVRQCECETCVRVFYDETKNHTRRWCVEKCGSRTKSAAYYKRKRLALQDSHP